MESTEKVAGSGLDGTAIGRPRNGRGWELLGIVSAAAMAVGACIPWIEASVPVKAAPAQYLCFVGGVACAVLFDQRRSRRAGTATLVAAGVIGVICFVLAVIALVYLNGFEQIPFGFVRPGSGVYITLLASLLTSIAALVSRAQAAHAR